MCQHPGCCIPKPELAVPDTLEFNSFFPFFLPFSFHVFCFHPLPSRCSTTTSMDLCGRLQMMDHISLW